MSCLLSIALSITSLFCQDSTTLPTTDMRVVFMEPIANRNAAGLPVYKAVSQPMKVKRYHSYLKEASGKLALHLFSVAYDFSHDKRGEKEFYILLEEDGNDAGVGFSLQTDSGYVDRPRSPFIRLDSTELKFKANLLHETGHAILSLLNGGKPIRKREVSSLPHSTASLTDRGTAFDEGFAIHLETFAAHYLQEPRVLDRYYHRRFVFGAGKKGNCLNWHTSDLLTFAQSRTRSYDVEENNFAFASSNKEADYVRVQLDKSRDYSLLRSANQLLQSEGFYASFFFCYLVNGDEEISFERAMAKEHSLISELEKMLRSIDQDSECPVLLKMVEGAGVTSESSRGPLIDIFLELSHGVFVDPKADETWRTYYNNALALNLEALHKQVYDDELAQWKQKITTDPKVIYSLLGPQLKVVVKNYHIRLNGFKIDNQLTFDLNTAEEGVIKLIPGITAREAGDWLSERRRKPFESFAEFVKRCRITPRLLREIEFISN